jgi:hypothetical protein
MISEIQKIALERIDYLAERAIYHEKFGDKNLKEFFLAEAKILAITIDGADNLWTMKYHRYLSDSFGVAFEQQHGDPELMFGGV